ncbi:DUF1307 domain-containing protein [Phocicoccus pinnipedialis]|uniref:Lipoprotein n=1 Tax=Phocicoccus pinnipedialis TaxID=110845 RepID=A0A6V7R4F8_9BACL|nr:DUF1307 domain-containing protein [Jeotgalicoccus pinnipedialis]MBP1939638.1 uncharacterized lipoprotein YehR (DUF1307 family) [Jeotgalicoccus pinnipedialis]CAD2072260.1 hypothetical protein JEOPIN946_00358 [Jeotgalicoccus pinnipedialis]
MRKFWLVLLSLSFITLVACSNDDKKTERTEESKNEKTEEVEKEATSSEEATDSEADNNTTSKSLYDESKAKTNVMKKEATGLESSIEMKHAEDVLLEQTQITEGDYSTLGVENEQEARDKIKDIGDAEKYKDQEGVEYKVEYTDNTFIETFKVDYTVADLNLVASMPEGTSKESQFVSYQLSVDNFKKQGYYLEGEQTTEVFRGEKEGYLYEVAILQDGKNKVLKQTTYNEQTYASLDLADKAAAEEKFKDTVKGYEELSKEDGVSFEMKFEEDKFTVDGVIDYEKIADIDKVLAIMGIDPTSKEAKEEARNYTVTASGLLSNGLQYIETKK